MFLHSDLPAQHCRVLPGDQGGEILLCCEEPDTDQCYRHQGKVSRDVWKTLTDDLMYGKDNGCQGDGRVILLSRLQILLESFLAVMTNLMCYF